MKQYKILLSNVGYCTGLNGSYLNYILRCHRYFYRPQKAEKQVLKTLKKIIDQEHPDLCCLIEIEDVHAKALKNSTYQYVEFDNKYGQKSLLRKLPIFSKKGNGYLAKENYSCEKHFFKNGTKKIIYEIKLDSKISVFMAHFSLNAKTRAKQFKEMKQLVKDTPDVIICGDFNIFGGFRELKPLLEDKRLRIVNTKNDKTFPAHCPKKVLDIFIVSKNIKVNRFNVLQDQFSDHLPVILEFKI